MKKCTSTVESNHSEGLMSVNPRIVISVYSGIVDPDKDYNLVGAPIRPVVSA